MTLSAQTIDKMMLHGIAARYLHGRFSSTIEFVDLPTGTTFDRFSVIRWGRWNDRLSRRIEQKVEQIDRCDVLAIGQFDQQ